MYNQEGFQWHFEQKVFVNVLSVCLSSLCLRLCVCLCMTSAQVEQCNVGHGRGIYQKRAKKKKKICVPSYLSFYIDDV